MGKLNVGSQSGERKHHERGRDSLRFAELRSQVSWSLPQGPVKPLPCQIFFCTCFSLVLPRLAAYQTDILQCSKCLWENTGQLKQDAIIIIIILNIFLSLLLCVQKIRALAQLTHSPSFLIGFSCRTSSRHWCIRKQILLSSKNRLFKAIQCCSQQLSKG